MNLISTKNLKKNILIIFCFFFVFNCASDNKKIKPIKIIDLDNLYKNALTLHKEGRFNESIKLFKLVETKYSHTEWSPKAKIMIIYMYYEMGETIKTLEYIKQFRNFYHNHKYIAYVDYIGALTFYSEIKPPSKDQTNTYLAIKNFERIIKLYPNTEYADDSKLKLDLLHEVLAGHEIYIARYYMKKSKWASAIKRLNTILEKYDRTLYVQEALHRLVEINYTLGNLTKAQKYASILGYNYNESDWYKKTYNIVSIKEYNFKDSEKDNSIKKKLINILKFSK